MKTPEWAANSRTIHAWVLWIVEGRRWGMKSLCGVRSPHDFAWGISVDDPGALEVAKRYYPHLSACPTCVDKTSNRPAESE